VTPLGCARCGTELPPDVLACPACAWLIHADALKQLAARADLATSAGDVAAARDHWTNALLLLPGDSKQHAAIRGRLDALSDRIDAAAELAPDAISQPSWWRRGLPGLATAALLLAGKLKFLLLGLTKASTFLSMFAFFGLYWSIYGWPLALGLVLAIYVHEMGHVAMLRRLGIDAGAPMFIPGVGAFVMLKQKVSDPLTDAQIGLAGPVWGLGAALVALAVYAASGARVWLAIAQLTGFLNLFNLIPVWQLDGSRGLHVLARGERWVLVAAITVALLLTEQRLLLIVGGVAIWRALQQDAGPGDRRVLATFVVLVIGLSFLARGVA
jgi:Zn-dependent protease